MTRPAAFAAALAWAVIGCGAAPAPRIARRVGGERIVGSFVSPYSYEHFLRAELALARGDLEEAADAYELARAGPEEDPLVLARLAEVLDRLERTEAADAALAEGFALDAEAEALWMARGRIAERRERVPEALDAYDQAARAAPRSEQAPLALARLLSARGALGSAERVLLRFADRADADGASLSRARLELALARDDADGAARAVEQLLDRAPARAADVERVATAALEAGRPAVAARLLEAVPASLGDARLRVRALAAAGRTERAEALLSTVPEERLGDALDKAELYLQVGRPDRALELAEAAGVAEADPRAHRIAGLARLARAEHAEAARALARVPRQVAGYAQARIALAAALSAEGLGHLAADVLSTTVASEVADQRLVREAHARARVDAGDLQGALLVFADARDPHGRARRAVLLERAGRTREALRAWARVGDRDTSIGLGPRDRARAERFVADGAPEQAVTLLQALVRRDRHDLYARARLAELLLATGHPEDAREAATEALRHAHEPALVERLRALVR